MRKPTYLFDASSIIRAIKEVKLIPLAGQAVQWLTVYEVVNAFWKETSLLHKLSLEEAASLTSDFEELLRDMVILEPRGLEEEILKISISKKITANDVSYIAIAAKHNLILVTENQKLAQKASNIVNVTNLGNIT